MIKTAPSPAKIAAMLLFAASCVGILIFLWTSFGGSIPLASNSYRVQMAFPQAINVADQSDVRIAGVSVGHVTGKRRDPSGRRTIVTAQIDPQYAPLASDAHAALRRKTILSEAFIEIAPGSPNAPKLKDGGRLPDSQVKGTVELDQILRVFDPQTKKLFRDFVKNGASVLQNRSQDVNDAIGNLPGFAESGSALLAILDRHDNSLRRLIRDGGTVLEALTRRDGELRSLVVNSDRFFSATAQERASLAQTFEIFPTFLDESRKSLARLQTFSADARPFAQRLGPVADELKPTLHDAGRLGPPLIDLLDRVPGLVSAGRTNLPQAERFLTGLPPLFRGLNAFLPELNPIISYAAFARQQVGQFLAAPSAGVGKMPPVEPGGPNRWYLKQIGITDQRSVSLNRSRPDYERGNAYFAPNALKRTNYFMVPEVFASCSHTGGERRDPDPAKQLLPCFIAPQSLWDHKYLPRPQRGEAPTVPPPRDTEGTKPVPLDLPPFGP